MDFSVQSVDEAKGVRLTVPKSQIHTYDLGANYKMQRRHLLVESGGKG